MWVSGTILLFYFTYSIVSMICLSCNVIPSWIVLSFSSSLVVTLSTISFSFDFSPFSRYFRTSPSLLTTGFYLGSQLCFVFCLLAVTPVDPIVLLKLSTFVDEFLKCRVFVKKELSVCVLAIENKSPFLFFWETKEDDLDFWIDIDRGLSNILTSFTRSREIDLCFSYGIM